MATHKRFGSDLNAIEEWTKANPGQLVYYLCDYDDSQRALRWNPEEEGFWEMAYQEAFYIRFEHMDRYDLSENDITKATTRCPIKLGSILTRDQIISLFEQGDEVPYGVIADFINEMDARYVF